MMTERLSPARRRSALACLAGLALAAAACATTGSVPRPFPGASRAIQPGVEMTLSAARVVEVALLLQGAPYRDGGFDPSGFDCSGLVHYVFGQSGMTLPRTTREQWAVGLAVATDAIVAGDLLFFTTKESGPTHVAIALDRTRFIHAPSERTVVRVDSLATSYWRERLIGVRRVI